MLTDHAYFTTCANIEQHLPGRIMTLGIYRTVHQADIRDLLTILEEKDDVEGMFAAEACLEEMMEYGGTMSFYAYDTDDLPF